MINIYHNPHHNNVGESFFAYFLSIKFPNANFVYESYQVDNERLNNSIDTQELIMNLKNDFLLPENAKERCLEILGNCPPYIRVANNPNNISFDFVITEDERVFYWEFHEKQHRNLTVNQDSYLYNAENNQRITVPRYLQRLIRDVWKVRYLKNYTIIWQDWFIQNCYNYQPELQLGFHEYFLPNKFSFGKFLVICKEP